MTTPDYCCPAMRDAIDGWKGACRHHRHAHECPDALIDRWATGEHGILVHDGGMSHVAIRYCPWCGVFLGTIPLTADADYFHRRFSPIEIRPAAPG
jgi:hypothetical protein